MEVARGIDILEELLCHSLPVVRVGDMPRGGFRVWKARRDRVIVVVTWNYITKDTYLVKDLKSQALLLASRQKLLPLLGNADQVNTKCGVIALIEKVPEDEEEKNRLGRRLARQMYKNFN